ncbi:Carboxymuconolactone decarboxylase family protein [Rhodobacteraceae bacterium THAF1]|uniref:peroxidase-related enzyme n=1 Tax=Palleronia sp. THAF1 TaxID=2587842 RepID=UPI000F3AFC2B|nr:peroxidase-related enzyme [Palleronia sp. THAF1]QFU08827.1 Carboxymuconolactone decarboxylase family protein [Palleronia sp. THAF1]VDC23962.1 Carboxymuconolactone decarboxylase family protein [Rhodobacteraceae bacterium THAF1]
MTDVLTKFTRKVPQWRPRLTPVDLQLATDEQLAALKVTPSNTKVSAYVLTLAHDVESLAVRSPLFNAIMYDTGGMRRAERELGALGSSMVNHCVYCAAVHADRHTQIENSTDVTDALFRDGVQADLGQRDRAIFDFAVALSACPPAATDAHMDALRDAGLDSNEVLDLILSVSLFGCANRLMHVLGDPVRPAEDISKTGRM